MAPSHPRQVVGDVAEQVRERAADRLRAMLTARFLAEIAPHLRQPDGQVRAALAASHLLGVAIARYVVRAEPIAGLDRATLVAVSAPVVQGFLTGPPVAPT